MTNTAPNHSVDLVADQHNGPADELENWLTDIRVTLKDDPPDWLAPEDDTTDPDHQPAAADHQRPDGGTPTRSAPPNGEAAVGRHRAAD